MATIGKIAIEMVANTARFVSDVKKGQNAIGRFSKQVQKDMKAARKSLNAVGQSVLKFGTVFAGAAGLMIRNSLSMADTTTKFADKLGDSVTALTELQAAGARADVQNTTLNMGLQRMTRRVAEAATGTGEAVKALDELGLSAEDLKKLSPSDQFKAITEAMSGVPDQADKVRLAFKLFDAEGVDLVNLMALGVDGMEKWAEEGRKTGAVLSAIDASRMQEANEAIDRGSEAFKGLGNILTSAVSPAIALIANGLADASVENNGFRDAIETTSVIIIGVVGAMATAYEGFFGFVKIGWLLIQATAFAVMEQVQQAFASHVGRLATIAGVFSDEWKASLQAVQMTASIEARKMAGAYTSSLKEIDVSAADTAESLRTIETTTADMQFAAMGTAAAIKKSMKDTADTTKDSFDSVGASYSRMLGGMVTETVTATDTIAEEEAQLAQDINAAFRTIPPTVDAVGDKSLDHLKTFAESVQKLQKDSIKKD